MVLRGGAGLFIEASCASQARGVWGCTIVFGLASTIKVPSVIGERARRSYCGSFGEVIGGFGKGGFGKGGFLSSTTVSNPHHIIIWRLDNFARLATRPPELFSLAVPYTYRSTHLSLFWVSLLLCDQG
jgi:hypothetical protein